ncbi:hypothetical protein [Collimonas humicola]|uniref:hypothetical protein n=1 Tax=Collimonas humicola TaxID=2825886 RepID=UPI001B8C2B94|nr:hypothetical protein [Collimonas humicola]
MAFLLCAPGAFFIQIDYKNALLHIAAAGCCRVLPFAAVARALLKIANACRLPDQAFGLF